MPIDALVKKPEAMTLSETKDALARIIATEQETGLPAGVLSIQKRLGAGYHEIVTVKEAVGWMSLPVVDDGKGNRTPEWGVKFYSRSYFEQKINKLSQKEDYAP